MTAVFALICFYDQGRFVGTAQVPTEVYPDSAADMAHWRQEVGHVSTGAERYGDDRRISRHRESLDEQVLRRGLSPVRSLDDVARDDVFESDEELDAFLAHVYAERQANLA